MGTFFCTEIVPKPARYHPDISWPLPGPRLLAVDHQQRWPAGDFDGQGQRSRPTGVGPEKHHSWRVSQPRAFQLGQQCHVESELWPDRTCVWPWYAHGPQTRSRRCSSLHTAIRSNSWCASAAFEALCLEYNNCCSWCKTPPRFRGRRGTSESGGLWGSEQCFLGEFVSEKLKYNSPLWWASAAFILCILGSFSGCGISHRAKTGWWEIVVVHGISQERCVSQELIARPPFVEPKRSRFATCSAGHWNLCVWASPSWCQSIFEIFGLSPSTLASPVNSMWGAAGAAGHCLNMMVPPTWIIRGWHGLCGILSCIFYRRSDSWGVLGSKPCFVGLGKRMLKEDFWIPAHSPKTYRLLPDIRLAGLDWAGKAQIAWLCCLCFLPFCSPVELALTESLCGIH